MKPAPPVTKACMKVSVSLSQPRVSSTSPRGGGCDRTRSEAEAVYFGACMTRPSLEQRLLRPIVLTRPVRLVEPNSWVTHVPFAFWLVDALRPRLFVELGTHSGNSYAAFAQAVQATGTDAACYAVDSWSGDAQAGYYGEDIFRDWSAFHDLHFASFSRLVRATFDDALEHFDDGTIDLLHIDGLHTYDAVRHDFENWRAKLSPRAVVLFHDVNVREGDFGAWRYWDALRAQFPSFTFTHGHGLGVLAVGSEPDPEVSWLVRLPNDGEEASLVRRFFSGLGDAMRLQLECDASRLASGAAASQVRELEAALAVAEESAAAARATGDDRRALRRQITEVEAARDDVIVQRNALKDQLAAIEAARDEAARRLENAEAEAAARLRNLSECRQLEQLQSERARQAEYSAGAAVRRVREMQATLQDTRAATETFEQHVRLSAAARVAQAPQPKTSGLARVRGRLRDAGIPLGWAARRPLRFARAVARLRRREYRRLTGMLAESGLFDAAHYRAVTGAGPLVNPVARFLTGGDAAGESPHPLFDPAWYLQQNPDLADVAPLQHYLRSGGWELRSPHPLFDARHYVAQWPAGSITALTPLTHYVRVGGAAGASPHPLFDAGHVLSQRPDLGVAGVNLLLHYLRTGADELLDPHPLFASRFYVDTNPDLAGGNPLEHFVRHGAAEGRSPHPLVDIGFYWERRPDVRAEGANVLLHYLAVGLREDVDPHPLFDTSFYLAQAAGVREIGLNPLVHYLRWGWRDGLSPNPWFDPQYYVERYPDVRGVNPLLHFMQHGWREHRDPSPEFSVAGYLRANQDIPPDGLDPLSHFLRHGRTEGRTCGRGPVTPSRAGQPVVLRISSRTPAPPTVLCVSHVSPWPVRAGNEYRLSRLLRHFRDRGYRVVLVLAPIDSEPLAPGAFEHLATELGNVVLCHRDGRVEHRLRDVPDVLSPLSGLPLAPADGDSPLEASDRAFCHDVVYLAAVALARVLGPTVVLAEYIFMTRVFSGIGPNALKVVDTIDVFSQKGSNVMAYGIGDHGVAVDVESRMLARADVVVAIHPADAAAFEAMSHSRDVIVTGVDADVQTVRAWPSEPVAFLPGSSNALNLAGLRDFLRFAWPRVLAAVPGATLRVAGGVGRAVPPGTPGVQVLGHVPDLAAQYASARVVINPAVAGTGLKIKTVEALAHLTPVVGWHHNRDGLPPSLGAFVDEARDWRDFADTVVGRLTAGESPFHEDGIRSIRHALSAETIYRALDERVDRFFARSHP